MLLEMAALWQANVDVLLNESSDLVTVYYKAERIGSDPSYDSFGDEGADSSSPDDVGAVSESVSPPIDVYGKMHFDLYGTAIAGGEKESYLSIGNFPPGTILFTCLLSDVQIDSDPIITVFDNCDYVLVNGLRYQLVAPPKYRGLGTPYVVDVFMENTTR